MATPLAVLLLAGICLNTRAAIVTDPLTGVLSETGLATNCAPCAPCAAQTNCVPTICPVCPPPIAQTNCAPCAAQTNCVATICPTCPPSQIITNVPQAITNLHAVVITPALISLAWNWAGTNWAYVSLFRKDLGSAIVVTLPYPATNFTDSSVQPGQTYFYDAGGWSPPIWNAVTTSNPPAPTTFLAQINTGGNGTTGWAQDDWDAWNGPVTNVITTAGITNPPPQIVLQDYALNPAITVSGMIPNAPYTATMYVAEMLHNSAGDRNEFIILTGNAAITTNNLNPWAMAGGNEFAAVAIVVHGTASTNGTLNIAALYTPAVSSDHNAILGPVRITQP